MLATLIASGLTHPEMDSQAQRAFELVEEQTKRAFELVEEKASLGVWSWDIESQRMRWSKGMFRLLGLEPDSLEPSYALLIALSHPDDHRSADELEHLFAEGGSFERKFRIYQPDGRVRWVLSRGEFFASRTNRPKTGIGVLVDITSLHAAELKAEAFFHRYSFVVESISAVVWTADAKWQMRDVGAWTTLTGQTPENLADDGWLKVIHVDDQPKARQARDFARANRRPYLCEYRIRQRDGSYRWFRSRAVPTFMNDGSISEWTGISIDIHDVKIWSPSAGPSIITGAQIRAARGILNWSIRDLAEASEISPSSIRRLEESDGPSDGSNDILLPLKAALETAGVEFLFPFAGKPGVRPR
jgi:PAS domain S-box-containing protein